MMSLIFFIVIFVLMKSWVIYLVTFLYLSTATQFSQLYKLPVFVTHFIEHDNGGAFLKEMREFIVHHYGGHEMDEDWETDQKLPFIKVKLAHVDFFFSPISKFNALHVDKTISTLSIKSFDEHNIYSHYLNSIWQPPKQT